MGQVGRRRRRRWPYVILVLLVLTAAGLVGLDLAARIGTQNLIATDVQRSTHSRATDVSISSFPFLYDVTADGRIQRVTVTDSGVPAGPFRIDQVRLDASGVYFARSQLLERHSVRITEVDRATVTIVARLSGLEGSLANKLNVQVTADGSDRIRVTADGHTVATINLTKIPIVPQCPLNFTHNGDSYTFSCTVSPVPPAVLVALSKAASGKKA
ncbi:MAG TPA: LmeA family phospholipid-binding protein [Acidimicrobiales bacterium]|nr:LmeA family phospholipid-binding protein [Acidimicrobiales bacterium]